MRDTHLRIYRDLGCRNLPRVVPVEGREGVSGSMEHGDLGLLLPGGYAHRASLQSDHSFSQHLLNKNYPLLPVLWSGDQEKVSLSNSLRWGTSSKWSFPSRNSEKLQKFDCVISNITCQETSLHGCRSGCL